MDISNKALMDEIVKRVAAKLQEMEQSNDKSVASSHGTAESSQYKDGSESTCNNCSSRTSESNEKVTYTRRLLSEKDIVEHNKAGIKKIVYSKNTIVTDVAKDYAKKYEIKLIKQN